MAELKTGLIDEMIRRIVDAVAPERIIIFGSAAKGEMGPHSEIDLLVIMPDGIHRRRTAQLLYRKLAGIGFAKDIVVVTDSDVREYGDNAALVIYPALREGREIYNAAG